MTCEEYIVSKFAENEKKLEQITEDYDELAEKYNELALALDDVKNMLSIDKSNDYIRIQMSIYNRWDSSQFNRLVEIFSLEELIKNEENVKEEEE